MKNNFTPLLFLCMMLSALGSLHSQSGEKSVARRWNEVLLNAIRVDVGRPTVHARNLFHVSAVMYDAWAAYDPNASTFLLGQTVGGYECQFDGISIPDDALSRKIAQEEAMSYAAYRLLKHRFAASPGRIISYQAFDDLMISLGFDTSFTSTDYTTGSSAALGNYLALSCMELGLADHSNEELNYNFDNSFYQAVNPPLSPSVPGTQGIMDLNHWQPLSFSAGTATRHLTPQWGGIIPFSLTENDLTIFDKGGQPYYVYHDPGAPPHLDTTDSQSGMEDFYKWNFALVAIWSGHLDPSIPTMVDISPATGGNLKTLPTNEAEFREFYRLLEGGVQDSGYTINPRTGQPYEPQIVPMGDFARVLAEFWADGPNSETPPGHWYTILNYVSDHPLSPKKMEGQGETLDDLEWDVKSYLALGGALHDVAISVWGIKSYYDYVRPISAIRGMAELGQSSDSTQVSYHPAGIPLVEGHIELVDSNDILAGSNYEHVGKIKIYAWRGPDYITDPVSSFAGVDWILAENWWPYQRPTFVTPPFPGYVSGHSTFSRAAAEVLTLLTGDEYFPGGMGIFDAPKDQYLVFEDGPSVDIELQWAKYRDASDEASLSRLWGGIHPPIDDIPGRKLGQKIGPQAFSRALELFAGESTASHEPSKNYEPGMIRNYPNPVYQGTVFEYSVRNQGDVSIEVIDLNGKTAILIPLGQRSPGLYTYESTEVDQLNSGMYLYRLKVGSQLSKVEKILKAE